jgi:glycosyltransferase involved in cell wall biosynthesis
MSAGGGARVTVVIPVWDAYAGDGLLEALASVRRQGVPAELIVVENASEVALPPLGDVELVHLGARCSTGAARNAALERLRTPYVVFLDADDLLLDGALAELTRGLDAAERSSAYVLSIIDGVTGKRHRTPRRFASALCRLPRLFALANTVWSLLPTQGAAIMRVRDVRACGGYGDSDHGEDWVLGTSLAFRGNVSFDRRPGLLYRRREDSPGVGALSGRVLLDNARAVRARVREDQAIPRWARSALPPIALAQWCAARIAHPLWRLVRGWGVGGAAGPPLTR